MYTPEQVEDTLIRQAKTLGCIRIGFNHRLCHYNEHEMCLYFTYRGKGRRVRCVYHENTQGLESIYNRCYKEMKEEMLEKISEIYKLKLLLLCLT